MRARQLRLRKTEIRSATSRESSPLSSFQPVVTMHTSPVTEFKEPGELSLDVENESLYVCKRSGTVSSEFTKRNDPPLCLHAQRLYSTLRELREKRTPRDSKKNNGRARFG